MQSAAAHYLNPNAALIADAFEFIDAARIHLKVAGIDAAYREMYKPRAYDYYRMALNANVRAYSEGECDKVKAIECNLNLLRAIEAVDEMEEVISRFDSVS